MKGKIRGADDKHLTCLVTGFEPFGQSRSNPSAELVEALSDRIYYGFNKSESGRTGKVRLKLHRQVLPTAGKSGWQALKKAIDETLLSGEGPVLLLMTGLAASRPHLSIERFALNVRDYGIADNEGAIIHDSFVDPEQPDLLRTSLALPPVAALIKAAGYPCEISNHAGTFICNELYFKALTYCRKHGRGRIKAVLFMHLPSLENFAESCAASPTRSVSRRAKQADSRIKRLRLLKGAAVAVLKAMVTEQENQEQVPVSGLHQ